MHMATKYLKFLLEKITHENSPKNNVDLQYSRIDYTSFFFYICNILSLVYDRLLTDIRHVRIIALGYTFWVLRNTYINAFQT